MLVSIYCQIWKEQAVGTTTTKYIHRDMTIKRFMYPFCSVWLTDVLEVDKERLSDRVLSENEFWTFTQSYPDQQWHRKKAWRRRKALSLRSFEARVGVGHLCWKPRKAIQGQQARQQWAETSGVERFLPKSQQLGPAPSTKETHSAKVGSWLISPWKSSGVLRGRYWHSLLLVWVGKGRRRTR